MSISIVIVDNEETDRYIARRHFSRADGFGKVLEFSSGRSFVETFKKRDAFTTPSESRTVVLMDISMPDMDGFQTIHRFLSESHDASSVTDTVFVMYSSSNDMMDREIAAGIGSVKGYITKPMVPDDVEVIRSLV